MAALTPVHDRELPAQFGKPVKVFPLVLHKRRHGIRIGMGIILILLGILSLLTGLYLSWRDIGFHGRAILLRTLPLPLGLFSAGILAGVLLLAYTHRHWQDGVSLYENGLVVREGKRVSQLLWKATTRFDSRIHHIKFGMSVAGEKFHLLFENDRGKIISLTGKYADMPTLVEQTRAAILPRLYANAMTRLRHGNQIDFAPGLSAVLKGIVIKDDLCRWDTLNPPRMQKNNLRLSRTGDNQVVFQIPIKRVRNLDLLLALFENPPLT